MICSWPWTMCDRLWLMTESGFYSGEPETLMNDGTMDKMFNVPGLIFDKNIKSFTYDGGFRITKEFKFECAHALTGYDGKCSHIHGHSYKLRVTVKGKPIDDPKSPKFGMVLDFNDLEKIIKENIIDKFDHALRFKKRCTSG